MHGEGARAAAGRLEVWGLFLALGVVACVGACVSIALNETSGEPRFVAEREETSRARRRSTRLDAGAPKEPPVTAPEPSDPLETELGTEAEIAGDPPWSPEEALAEIDRLWSDLERLRKSPRTNVAL